MAWYRKGKVLNIRNKGESRTRDLETLDDFIDSVTDPPYYLQGELVPYKSEGIFTKWLRNIGEEWFAEKLEPFNKMSMRDFTNAAVVLHKNLEREKGDLSAIVAYEDVKNPLLERVMLPERMHEINRKYGKEHDACILLYGPPGCGKTYIAKAVAGASGRIFLNAGVMDFSGMGCITVKPMFRVMRELGPTVLFIDEVETLMVDRDMEGLGSRMIANSMLSEIEERKGGKPMTVIGATNTPWIIDNAMLRAGRFDTLIYVGTPDCKTRVKLLEFYTKGLELEGVDFKEIAERTEFYSCADMKLLCQESAMIPWREAINGKGERRIAQEDFDAVLKDGVSTAIPWFESTRNIAFSETAKKRFAPMVREIGRYKKVMG